MIKLYTTGEIAKKINKSKEMVHVYIRQGKLLPYASCADGRQFLFEEKEIIRFQQQYFKNQ